MALQMTVEVPPAFHIFYATGWEEPVLRLRELRADGLPQHEVSSWPSQRNCMTALEHGWDSREHAMNTQKAQ